MHAIHGGDYRGGSPLRASRDVAPSREPQSLRGNLAALVAPSIALIGCEKSMDSNRQSDQRQSAWPFDLRVFAVLAGLWAVCLTVMAFVQVADVEVVDPIETIF
ncbi:MAG: hypothetical protein WA827_20210, partial [Candidatus Binatus sp.]